MVIVGSEALQRGDGGAVISLVQQIADTAKVQVRSADFTYLALLFFLIRSRYLFTKEIYLLVIRVWRQVDKFKGLIVTVHLHPCFHPVILVQ